MEARGIDVAERRSRIAVRCKLCTRSRKFRLRGSSVCTREVDVPASWIECLSLWGSESDRSG
jgi:hypothetical protein